jgi:glutamine---fructose-6-phosphate transaminase (isomerizing)
LPLPEAYISLRTVWRVVLFNMCSIIGYLGNSRAAPVLVEALKKMEYRGYDSVGIATSKAGRILTRKGVGKVAEVNSLLHLDELSGEIGIGHTRWATHGAVTSSNAHPHSSCKADIGVVHNGVIENYHELKEGLSKDGHIFKSDTDSEVIAHLLEHYMSRNNNDIKDAMIKTSNQLKGSFAFVAIFNNSTLCGSRFDEPLIVGIGKDKKEFFVSSDVLGFLMHTDQAVFLDNRDIILLEGNELSIFDFDGKEVSRPITQVAWELADSEKGKYAYYTLKEIHEQVRTVFKSMEQKPTSIETFCNILKSAKDIYVTGSGTSYHTALLAKNILSKYLRIRTEAIMSSEFQYSTESLDENSVVIAISQSGETADVLKSVQAARKKRAKVLSIVNVTTSSLARLSDCFLEVKCGPEIGVAATKSFTSQLAVLYFIMDSISGNLTGITTNSAELSSAIQQTLELEPIVVEIAKDTKNARDIYIVGRSIHFPICLEAALKIKELAYIHAEGIAAGELKHGPLALIDKNSVVIILNPNDSTYIDTVSNAHVIKSRGAKLIGISDKGKDDDKLYDHFIKIPSVSEQLLPLIEIIPLQMLAYYLALSNNIDPDYPRNLAKSVTVN